MKLSAFLAETGIQAMTFGERIGLKQPNSIYRYIRGERMPSQEVMQAIARETGGRVTANDFYGIEAAALPASPEAAGNKPGTIAKEDLEPDAENDAGCC